LAGHTLELENIGAKMRKSSILLFTFLFSFLSLHQATQAAWTTKRLTWNAGTSVAPAIAEDLFGHIHVVWHDNTPGYKEIFYKKSTDNGATWSAKRLIWNVDNSYDPVVTTNSNTDIHVAWKDDTPGRYEIYYRKGIQLPRQFIP
jgi:hypothetical protein